MMKAVEIMSNALHITRRPIPIPNSQEVLIKVAYAGINRPDVIQRQGMYKPPKGASDIPGLEVSGTVCQTPSQPLFGADGKELVKGAKVCTLIAGGGYAEFAAAPARCCLPVPSRTTLREAAALPETFSTVWFNLCENYPNPNPLSPGRTLLVHGGSSGIGTSAIQLAQILYLMIYFFKNISPKYMNVITTAGSTTKCKVCEDLGASLVINYVYFKEEIVKHCGKNVDMILDMVGGDYVCRFFF
eukprot:GSMAST32.ASY1.ANO1.226.1 assembled CDS